MVISYSRRGIAVDLFLPFTEFSFQVFDPLIEISHKSDMFFLCSVPKHLHPLLALFEPFEIFSDSLESEFGFVDRLRDLLVYSYGNLLSKFLEWFFPDFLIHHDLLCMISQIFNR